MILDRYKVTNGTPFGNNVRYFPTYFQAYRYALTLNYWPGEPEKIDVTKEGRLVNPY